MIVFMTSGVITIIVTYIAVPVRGRDRDPPGCPMPCQPDRDHENLVETFEDLANRPGAETFEDLAERPEQKPLKTWPTGRGPKPLKTWPNGRSRNLWRLVPRGRSLWRLMLRGRGLRRLGRNRQRPQGFGRWLTRTVGIWPMAEPHYN